MTSATVIAAGSTGATASITGVATLIGAPAVRVPATARSNPDFFIAVGDTIPTLDAALFGGDQIEPVDLTGASGVQFTMYALGGGTPVLDQAASVTDAANGRVRYAWQAGDTGTAGVYLGRFVVTYLSGDTQRFPNDRHIEIHIT